MSITRREWIALASGLAASLGAGAAFAANRVIKVSLWDTGAIYALGMWTLLTVT